MASFDGEISTSFVYQPLRPKQIRLLHLIPKGDSFPLGRLEHVSFLLAKGLLNGRYHALSYTWGDDEATEDFICNGGRMKIRKNLAQALVRLAPANFKKPIWIDAICIDQTNMREKLEQIQLMPQIYKNAGSVFVWLGEETPSTSAVKEDIVRAIDSIKAGPSSGEAVPTSLQEDLSTLIDKLKPASRSSSKRKEFKSTDAICEILTRSWYGRVWTLQEATLAQKVEVFIGGQKISWDLLEKFVRAMTRAGLRLEVNDETGLGEKYTALAAIPDIEICRASYRQDFFTKIIQICRKRDCFDPRDRIRGILGMIPMYRIDEKLGMRDIKNALKEAMTNGLEAKIDGNQPIADVYIPFTVFMLQEDLDMRGLSMIESKVRDSSLPSWCPDFHQRPEASMLAEYSVHEFRNGYGAGFQAFRNNHPVWDLARPGEIILKGSTIDSLEIIVDGHWEDLRSVLKADSEAKIAAIKRNRRWLASCQQAVRNLQQDPATDETDNIVSEMLSRTIVADQVENEKICDVDSLLRDLHRLEQMLERDPTANPLIKLLSSPKEPLRAISHACVGRRFCITAQGRLCLSPASAQKDDLVCLVRRASVPFICRPIEGGTGKMSIMGEAYVHGCMRGEAITAGMKWEQLTFV